MKVFVTGGAGAIGGHVVPALVSDGQTVSALARTPDKATVLTEQGATPVSGSIFDGRPRYPSAREGWIATAKALERAPATVV